MKNPNWLMHSMDDIVFDGRNKAYGAFQLRRLYDKHMTRAMIVGVLFFLLAVSSPKIIQLIKGYMPEKTEDPDSRIVTLETPPPTVPKTLPPPAPPEVKPPPIKDQIKFVPPVVRKDDDVRDDESDQPMVQDLNGKIIGRETKDSVEGSVDEPMFDDVPTAPPALEEPIDDTPFAYVEQMPAFPGGLEAMYKFIRNNMDYPDIANENKISGKVVVQFVVSREGEIQNAKVVGHLGGGCDEEALRVINSMPRWKPGMHNGRAVPVTFTLPIKFVLQ